MMHSSVVLWCVKGLGVMCCSVVCERVRCDVLFCGV